MKPSAVASCQRMMKCGCWAKDGLLIPELRREPAEDMHLVKDCRNSVGQWEEQPNHKLACP